MNTFIKLAKREKFSFPDGESDWQYHGDSFSRQEVFNLLWTQAAMIGNDIRRECNLDGQEVLLDIINNPRIPKF